MMDDLDIKDTFDTVQRKSRLSDLALDDDHTFGTKIRKSKLKVNLKPILKSFPRNQKFPFFSR